MSHNLFDYNNAVIYDVSMTGAEIKALRTALGLSKASFARLVGTNPVSVSRWESGEVKASPVFQRILANVERDLVTKSE